MVTATVFLLTCSFHLKICSQKVSIFSGTHRNVHGLSSRLRHLREKLRKTVLGTQTAHGSGTEFGCETTMYQSNLDQTITQFVLHVVRVDARRVFRYTSRYHDHHDWLASRCHDHHGWLESKIQRFLLLSEEAATALLRRVFGAEHIHFPGGPKRWNK